MNRPLQEKFRLTYAQEERYCSVNAILQRQVHDKARWYARASSTERPHVARFITQTARALIPGDVMWNPTIEIVSFAKIPNMDASSIELSRLLVHEYLVRKCSIRNGLFIDLNDEGLLPVGANKRTEITADDVPVVWEYVAPRRLGLVHSCQQSSRSKLRRWLGLFVF
jgi:hypothetical protein